MKYIYRSVNQLVFLDNYKKKFKIVCLKTLRLTVLNKD